MTKVKRKPRQLERPEPLEIIWPGPDLEGNQAVDIAASDLIRWCRSCGQEGLVMASDEVDPITVTIKPLGRRAMGIVSERNKAESYSSYLFEAARFGIVRVSGLDLRKQRNGGVVGLTDEALDLLADEIEADIPSEAAIDELFHVRDGKPRKEDEYVPIPSDLAEVMGVHVLVATFRASRRSH